MSSNFQNSRTARAAASDSTIQRAEVRLVRHNIRSGSQMPTFPVTYQVNKTVSTRLM